MYLAVFVGPIEQEKSRLITTRCGCEGDKSIRTGHMTTTGISINNKNFLTSSFVGQMIHILNAYY